MNGHIPNYVRRGDILKAADVNRLIDAVRRATPIAGDGIMVSQTLAGSRIDVVRGIAAGAVGGGGDAGNAPFALAVEHVANGNDYCIFLYAEKAFAVNGTAAACWNNASAADSGWRRVADGYTEGTGAGVVTDATINDLEDGESVDVYAVAFSIGDGFSYLVLPTVIYATGGTAPTVADIPEGLKSSVAAQVFVGTVSRTGTDGTTGDAIYAVSNQAVRSAVSLSETDANLRPWTVRATAMQGGGYALTVYLPTGCCQADSSGGIGGVTLTPTNGAVEGGGGWYTIGEVSAGVSVYAHCAIGDGHFTVNTTSDNSGNQPSPKIAVVSVSGGTATVSQIVNYNIVVKQTQAAGGGTTVTVTDQRTDRDKAGIVGMGADGATGVTLLVRDGIGADIVAVTDTALLNDYLAGSVQGPSGEYAINTENFAEKCLGPSGEIKGEEDTAARSDHFHEIGDIRMEGGATGFFDKQENLITIFSNVGLWDETIGQPTGVDDYGSLITADDANWDDASVISADEEIANPGGLLDGSQMFALADHAHPLNVANRGTVPSGATAPVVDGNDTDGLTKAVGSCEYAATGYSSLPETPYLGTDSHYARADHIHPICADMAVNGATGPTAPVCPLPNGDGYPTGTNIEPADYAALDTTTWEPGNAGFVESYCSRVVKQGTNNLWLYFRNRKISRTGQVVWVGPEYAAFPVRHI